MLLAHRQSGYGRAILLDWGGTLSSAETGFYDVREDTGFEVPEETLQILRTLCADPSNHVMVLSGLDRDKVQRAFGSVPNLSLAVEHGFHYRVRSGPWQQLCPGVDTSWREVAEAIIRVYTTRTNGSYLQKKGSSMVWNYQHADPEFGALQARELQYHLQGVLTAFPVEVRVGKGYVEACPKGVNKGVKADRFVDMVMRGDANKRADTKQQSLLQFVLCVGDDSSDELMFSTLHNKFGQHPTDLHLFTATVGRKPSCAGAYMEDHNEVVELLRMLSSYTKTRNHKAFASHGDLSELNAFAAFGDLGGGGGAEGNSRRVPTANARGNPTLGSSGQWGMAKNRRK